MFHVASEGSAYSRPAPQPGVTPAPVPGELRVRARYLVGADGGRSGVRAQLGIDMTGKNFPNPWLVVDIKAKDPADGLRHLPYFNFICDPACPTVSCVQPNGHHRFEFMLMPGQTREHMEHPDTVRHYLSQVHRRRQVPGPAHAGLHLQRADGRDAGATAACCWPATPRT